jgi:uncharacterized protein YbjT (DUF2867 family)
VKAVVIGGTGLIGSKVVARLRAQSHEAVPASPNSGVNTLTGEGLAEVLTGASVVVDLSNSPNFEYATALDFFATSTRHLLTAEASAGVRHHVALSVVGTESLSQGGDLAETNAGYFLAKLVQEALIRTSGIPYSIVHATQFFEFLAAIANDATIGDAVHVPPVLFQPMAADDVAAALGHVAVNDPVNGIVEVGGPEVFRFEEPVWRVLNAADDPRAVVTDPNARYFGIEVSERTLVPRDGARLGAITIDEWIRKAAAAKRAAA